MKNEALMQLAILEAGKALGRTHPNPAVGAVICHQDKVVATGFTQPAGQDHAEVQALKAFQKAGFRADESTRLVVTMEPCSTTGRTGACTDAIIAAGIPEVVSGTIDPNPSHSGTGFERLREAGIRVTEGVLKDDCEDLNLIFNWQMAHGTPFIAAKVATTLDGRMATRNGLSKWITGEAARADVHRWRRYFPAIAVGAGTVLADNPSLTARLEGDAEWCPIRFVFDRNLVSFKDRLPNLYSDKFKDRTIIITSNNHSSRLRQLEDMHGLRFWEIEDSTNDEGLGEFTSRCREEGISGVYIEGGAHVLSAFLKYRLIQYIFAYRAPKLLADSSGLSPFSGEEPASMQETVGLKTVRHASFGDDQLMRGFVVYPS
ncbi:bifunctional diaminohydroxyphosphoribosylaminopyrimidine deaminase/5-amino-6-(5-phosphoribosylamino)uracil reductase RibD [Puniceicoccales bacterium CK1056]|uniref:Riboflavin biosynthesis protein RibD n=1 Tax=Oceanipulchritudo coccoides TaxID=2706888 RepID=A0A6B2M1X5_9BACT|nr:bifunctional diaminohydroxyphosphoribosylaminopyrimidine deaminase/5-amino-6-(5-phosphoribosylamino)uracil reductase RibD [Oceanipulchritudo coccoides]NDV62733.1 bifunctional diaminohydroxyphosphoribosylaminopyrimidine deaminase/5-amino-6-(5-phosphoribosylamino)uracil reductase RibD [Oceanipulchritudo coccoides]